MKVKFVPQNVEFEIKPNESVMHVAQDNGIYIKSVCKGVPSCAECRVRIVEGEHNVLPPASEELSLIGTGHFIDRRRLSCQLKCFGDITVDMNEQIGKQNGTIVGRKKRTAVKDDRVEQAVVRRSEGLPETEERETPEGVVAEGATPAPRAPREERAGGGGGRDRGPRGGGDRDRAPRAGGGGGSRPQGQNQSQNQNQNQNQNQAPGRGPSRPGGPARPQQPQQSRPPRPPRPEGDAQASDADEMSASESGDSREGAAGGKRRRRRRGKGGGQGGTSGAGGRPTGSGGLQQGSSNAQPSRPQKPQTPGNS